MLEPRNLGWVAHNMIRNYPFDEQCSRVSNDGNMTLPQDFIVGLYMTIGIGVETYDPTRFFLSRLRSNGLGYSLQFSYFDGTEAIPAFAGSLPAQLSSTFIPGTPFPLYGTGQFASCNGNFSIGSFDAIRTQPVGVHSFSLESARLDPSTIKPSPIGVSAIYIKKDNEVFGPITGTITFASGNNTSITASPDPSDAFATLIVIDAYDPTGFNQNDTSAASYQNAIKTINSNPADNIGNFELVPGNNCISIVPMGDGKIEIQSTCSEPCCGCEQLRVVTEELTVLDTRATEIMNRAVNLATVIDSLNQVVLGSQINDIGCIQCNKKDDE